METQLHKEGHCNGGAYDGSSKTLTVESIFDTAENRSYLYLGF